MKITRCWDIFCKVIDNFGDIGVSWRLAADLGALGHTVRLWVDDAAALRWMAPDAMAGGQAGVRVLTWAQSSDSGVLADLAPADVWIEAFGCALEPAMVADRFVTAANAPARHPAPVWINLEYLSAEPFAASAHGLPSPILYGPASGHTRWFFYPGFGELTGGLIREHGLEQRRAAFDRASWLSDQGITWAGEQLVSLFCYEPAALPQLLTHFQRGPAPTLLLVTPGRAANAVRQHAEPDLPARPGATRHRHGALSVVYLPSLTQTDFDHLLWACDLNFVRGEDSLVRALWADRPFVWQIYPQHDGAHHAKLHALLDALQAPPDWRRFHQAWNGMDAGPLPAPQTAAWSAAVHKARRVLAGQSALTTRLVEFVDKVAEAGQKRPKGR